MEREGEGSSREGEAERKEEEGGQLQGVPRSQRTPSPSTRTLGVRPSAKGSHGLCTLVPNEEAPRSP